VEDTLTKTCLQCLPRERTGRIVHTEKPKRYCEDHNFWRGQQATMTVVFSSDPALDATSTVHGWSHAAYAGDWFDLDQQCEWV